MNPANEHSTQGRQPQRGPSRLSRFFMHVVLPGAALLGGTLITFYLLNTKPQARPAQRKPSATLVETRPLQASSQRVTIEAMGEVLPAREVALMPQVGGVITSASKDFEPGGFFAAGSRMLAIERTDYELALRQSEAAVARAESELALEMGNQRIAEREFSLLGEEVSEQEKELILRRPQLTQLQAARDEALARRDLARLDLSRTSITAPFNGVVTDKEVDIGAKVGEATRLATFAGTDFFWLQLTIPVDRLQWLDIPARSGERGARVIIHPQGSNGAGKTRQGEVVRLVSALEEQGRMAQLLVRVEDPLSLLAENRGKTPLLLGSYVRAEIQGHSIDSGFALARASLRDGDTVWLMDDEGRLAIRPVDVAYRGREKVIVTAGISEGERLVTTTLASPVAGTPLRVADAPDDGRLADSQGGESGRQSHVN